MSKCSACKTYRCLEGDPNLPSGCPVKTDMEVLQKALACYREEDLRMARAAAAVESAGYCRWPRVREIMEFARMMKYHKLGLAFCIGLRVEAGHFTRILESNGFAVCSAVCKTGSVPKEDIGIPPDEKLVKDGFEPMCNPLAQAALLDGAGWPR